MPLAGDIRRERWLIAHWLTVNCLTRRDGEVAQVAIDHCVRWRGLNAGSVASKLADVRSPRISQSTSRGESSLAQLTSSDRFE